ncbi:MAG: PTS sugar transporter subunit IIC [Deltaproteobacteria bacterium]|nr:PTS sugar transporter subunit IIC [Deltaproteobacteria bacterium]
MAFRFLLAAALGAVAYLDRTAAFQVMLHRPLVVATAMGAVFGNVFAGAQAGAVMELLYLARLPVGASIPPDDTGAAMFAGAAAAAASSSVGLSAGSFAAVLLLSVPCAELGKAADRLVRRINGRIATLTAESVERGDTRAVDNGLLAGVTLFALSGAILSLLFTGAGVAAGKLLLPRFGPAGKGLFAALLPILPLLGAASVFSCTRTDRTAPVFYLTMALVFAATYIFRWVG